MALSSSSTDAEVYAAFDDNVDYDLVGSEFKARELIKACRILISRTADQAAMGGEAVSQRTEKYERMMAAALKWLRRRRNVRHKIASFEGYRS